MRLYSEDWIAAFNEAVAGPGDEVGAGSAPEADVSFRMLQVVHGGADGTVRVALCVHEGRVSMERDPGDEPAPDVTVSVQFDDAVALARGELDPASLLAAGRVRVRGDLSVLVRGQALLAAAAGRLGPLSERTTS